MFCIGKWNKLDKPKFVTDCCLSNLAVCKKQTLLPNIKMLIKLVAAYPVGSIIVLADEYFNIRMEENSENEALSRQPVAK